MAFTWDGTITTTLAEVRHYTGDIDSNDPLLTDAQINFELTATGDDSIAAADRCFQRILAKLARDVDHSMPRFNTTRSQKFQHYKDLYAEFKATMLTESISPAVWSEHSAADATSMESDSDFKQPTFKIGQDDY
jgi:hypothetical protein